MSYSIVNITRYTNPSNLGQDTFTIPSTTAGNLLVVMGIGFAENGTWGSPTFVSANSDTLSEIPFYTLAAFFPYNAQYNMGSFLGGAVSADIWWCVTKGGTTSISFKCGLNPYFWVYEISGAAAWALDNFAGAGAPNLNQQPVIGPTISGAGSDIYFSVVATQNGNTTAVNSPWTLDPVALVGNAPAYILGSTGNQQATFTDSIGNDAFTIVGASFNGGTAGIIDEPQIDAFPSTALAGTFYRFRLRNFAGTVPRWIGAPITVTATSAAGSIAQAVIPNNAITPSGTFYTVEEWSNGRITSSANYVLNASVDLSNAVPR